MAFTTTMNSWMEELASTFLPSNTNSTELRKHKDAFVRKIKNHPYGRTDQFAVEEKLVGLEEKFLVLGLDDVAEELYSRRMELSRHYERWIPDILDLLLHLSHDPVKHSRVDRLQKVRPRSQASPPLKWADVEADDPIDRHDPIWQIPDYGDSSSDDDLALPSTKTSPASVQHKGVANAVCDRILDEHEVGVDLVSPLDLKAAQFWLGSEQNVTVSEKEAVREVLFMLGGLPTSMFVSSDRGIRPNPRYRIRHLEQSASCASLNAAASLGSDIGRVRRWVDLPQEESVMQLIRDGIKSVLADFERALAEVENKILHPVSSTGTISLLQILHTVRKKSSRLNTICALSPHLPQNDPIESLDTLYDQLDKAYSGCDSAASETLLPIFISAFMLYAKPLDVWLHTGRLDPSTPIFIHESKGAMNRATLWHDWFALYPEDERRAPLLLQPVVEKIFTAGKTAAFLQQLGRANLDHDEESLGLRGATEETLRIIQDSPIPFSETFELVLDRQLHSLLNSATAALKDFLEGHCGLTWLLDALDYLYLGVDGVILDHIETRLFDRIDRCLETWNDRFVVGDLLVEAYQGVECVDADSITVHSAIFSSRGMASRRRSVKILGALTVSYHVSWPLANIILPASLGSYRRICLILSQIRRAKFVLERRAYFRVRCTLFESDMDTKSDWRTAQATHATLLHFVNVIYSHLTTCTINPLTRAMRADLASSAAATGTVDDMIAVHTRYIRNLEHACLASNRIKPLRESLLAILDLCIRFADLLVSPGAAATSRHRSSNLSNEETSFISTRSGHRRRWRRLAARIIRASRHEMDSSSSDDDDDENEDIAGAGYGDGEGHSTFVLEEDSSVMQEIGTVREEFVKHASFLAAGLRGVARTSGEVGDGFELLADSLEGTVTGIRTGTGRTEVL